jgi:hypothetical protein
MNENEKLQKIKSVLEFYADPNNWITTSTGFSAQYEPTLPATHKDKGKMARKVLEVLDGDFLG